MRTDQQAKHAKTLPKARNIRRSCRNELYRAVKRLGVWIPEDKRREAEELYAKKVALNLMWIVENGSNRRKLCDWWEEQVCGEIAALWGVPEQRLARAFRDAFGG